MDNLALTPVLTNVISAQISKSDLLELVESEEEARLSKEIVSLNAAFKTTDKAYADLKESIKKVKGVKFQKKLESIAKSLGGKVVRFETKVITYNGWSHYSGEAITNKPVVVFCVEAVCAGDNNTFKMEMEQNLGDNQTVLALEKQRNDIQEQIHEVDKERASLKSRMKAVSAGITRKCLESNDKGKEILKLLAQLRNSVAKDKN